MKPTVGWLASVFSVIGIPVAAWAQHRPYDYWGMHPFGVWGIGMMLMMLVFWGLVITALVLGIRWLITHGREPRADSPLDILKKHYARGEIDKEEYLAKRQDLVRN